ncbi:MAG: ATP-binding protein [Candidatus Aegiribacteria sp.]|nr:ATP-binding protein [Candidatus Aegiribacteria sp.]
MFRKSEYNVLLNRMREPSRRIQVVSGPRQVGKTTMVRQVLDTLESDGKAIIYATSDLPAPAGSVWIEERWQAARILAMETDAILALDEVQKIRDWSETVKYLWDEEKLRDNPLSVVLLGSSALLMQEGLTESLAGRFELIRMGHWSLNEMHEAFGLDLEEYLVFGGYPGGADLSGDFSRWRKYILDSLIETSISRDILMMTRVDKPVLLRKLFMLACEYSCRKVSYNKMLGQLHDAGNTTTLAHYMELLQDAGLIAGLQKYSGSQIRKRGASPKMLPLNTALISAVKGYDLKYLRENPVYRGRIIEAAVGGHLYRETVSNVENDLTYWNAGGDEVDYVLTERNRVLGLEVYSGSRGHTRRGMARFIRKYPDAEVLLVGGDGVPIEKALRMNPSEYFA